MGYLLAKIFFLLLFAALGGALLMWWWLRRKFEDVTVSYTKSEANKKAALSDLDKLQTKYKTLESNLASKLDNVLGKVNPLEGRIIDLDAKAAIANLEQKLGSIQTQLSSLPEPKETNLAPVLSAVSNIKIPEAKETDLSSVLGAISRIHIPETKETDLSPVLERINQIRIPETNLSPVLSAIENIRIPEQKETNLSPVLEKIDHIRIPEQKETDLSPVMNAIKQIRIPEQKETNLSPVLEKINQIRIPEQKTTNLDPVLNAIRNIPTAKPIDLSQLYAEIKAIKIELAKRPKEIVKTIVEKVPSQQNKDVVANRLGDRGNRLRKAAFGKPDDLKVIKGVGPKLEKMLHSIGVYYYWQVADWTKDDVQEADDLLDAFKGRIERDNWVSQGKQLMKLPSSAKKP